jgi:hypothetical protein
MQSRAAMRGLALCALATFGVLSSVAHAQAAPSGGAGQSPPGIIAGVKMGGSPNIHLLGHVPLGGYFRVTDDALEQDPNRPYGYVSQARDRPGFTIIDLHDLNNIHVLYTWHIENPEQHKGFGGTNGKYFKSHGRYYYVQSLQFEPGTVDGNLGAVIADVTSLPDTTKVKIVARIADGSAPGGFRSVFAYKHSDGRNLLIATVNAAHANVYDLDKVLAGGDPAQWKVAEIPIPSSGDLARPGIFGYDNFYVAYDPTTHLDKLYGSGRGGYYVYDISNVSQPKLLTSITGVAGVEYGHAFTPTPDGRYAVTETEYQYAPLRIFDLQPGLTGKVQAITQPIGAWTADWHDLSHNHEVRWPFVFVSAYEDGLQVFSMYDPTDPTTVGWYYTCQCAHQHGFGGLPEWEGTSVMQGAYGIDIRNRDGLIMISDSNTGVWFFRMEGFNGWNGHDWGVPNVSSVQDWDHGPEGAQAKAAHVTA